MCTPVTKRRSRWLYECIQFGMDPLTTAAASGLRARMEALDMLSNNIANSSTAGFKKDGEFYGIFQEEEAQDSGADVNSLPLIEKPWTDFSQGVLQPTGNQLDFSLSGKGWFALNGKSGTVYTRSGNFKVSPEGVLTSSDGYSVRMVGGSTAQLRRTLPVEAGSDGTLTQGGVPVGRLEVVDFPTGALVKQGATLFRPVDDKQTGTAVPETEVHQGKLENANVSGAEAAARLIVLMRQFEGLQKAISIGADMNRKAVEDLARVGP